MPSGAIWRCARRSNSPGGRKNCSRSPAGKRPDTDYSALDEAHTATRGSGTARSAGRGRRQNRLLQQPIERGQACLNDVHHPQGNGGFAGGEVQGEAANGEAEILLSSSGENARHGGCVLLRGSGIQCRAQIYGVGQEAIGAVVAIEGREHSEPPLGSGRSQGELSR